MKPRTEQALNILVTIIAFMAIIGVGWSILNLMSEQSARMLAIDNATQQCHDWTMEGYSALASMMHTNATVGI